MKLNLRNARRKTHVGADTLNAFDYYIVPYARVRMGATCYTKTYVPDKYERSASLWMCLPVTRDMWRAANESDPRGLYPVKRRFLSDLPVTFNPGYIVAVTSLDDIEPLGLVQQELKSRQLRSISRSPSANVILRSDDRPIQWETVDQHMAREQAAARAAGLVQGPQDTWVLTRTRDGMTIYFDLWAAGKRCLYMVDSDGRDPPLVQASHALTSPMNQGMGDPADPDGTAPVKPSELAVSQIRWRARLKP